MGLFPRKAERLGFALRVKLDSLMLLVTVKGKEPRRKKREETQHREDAERGRTGQRWGERTRLGGGDGGLYLDP